MRLKFWRRPVYSGESPVARCRVPARKMPAFNLEIFRQLAQEKLISLLQSFSGNKDVVIESRLMKPLDRIISAAMLKENGVQKIFKLEQSLPSRGCDQRVYMVNADIPNMKLVADHINADISHEINRKYEIFMVPRKLFVCEELLEREGVSGFVTTRDFDISFIPLDNDILSMECPQFSRSFLLENDYSLLHTVAKALWDILSIFGAVPNLYGQGLAAKMVYDLMQTITSELGTPPASVHEIGHMFIFSRDVDFTSVLLTPVTYQGLLDEVFGINSGFIDFGPEVTGKDLSIKLLLTSQDKVFNEIRDMHISNVFTFLGSEVKLLQSKRDESKNMSIGDMKSFVENELRSLQQRHKSLALNIGACEVLMKKKSGDPEELLRTEHSLVEGTDYRGNFSFIEELINRQYEMMQCLRLLCLMSCANGGFSRKEYTSLKVQFLQSYGYSHLTTLFNLKKVGLAIEQEATIQPATTPGASKLAEKMAAAVVSNLPKRSSFQMLSKKLGLIPKWQEGYNLKNPTDLGYVFGGAYIPTVCNIVQQTMSDGFQSLEEVFKLLPGPTFTVCKPTARGKGGVHSTLKESQNNCIILVCFLGGVTYAEISALRLLGKLKGYQIIIAATSIVNGNTYLESFTDV